MRRAAIYARISEDQAGTGLGVQRQVKACQELAERRGWQVVAEFVDNDVSATRGTPRPGYDELLAQIEAGKVDAVVVWALDRLHRRPIELEGFVSLVEKHRVALANVAGDVDLSTPQGVMVARMMAAVAANEAATISRRVRAKQQQLRDAGRAFGGGKRPYGWEPDRMTAVEDEQVEIRRMVDWVLSGRSVTSLVRDLNDRAVPTVTGKPWHLTTVRTLLSRPRIAGLLTHKGEIIGEGKWEPIISRDEFDRVQQILSERGRPGRSATRGRKHLLSGIAQCATCQEPLQVSHTGGALRYRCPASQQGRTGGVRHGGRNMAALDAYVVKVMALLDQQRPHMEVDHHAVGAEVDRLRERLQTAADQFADDVIDGEQLATITKRLRDRIAVLEANRPPVWDPGTEYEWTVTGKDLVTAIEDFQAAPIEVQRRRVIDALGAGGHIKVAPSTKRGRGFDPSSVDVIWSIPLRPIPALPG